MLFDKNNNGSRELYELTGTFQASTDFRSIRSELTSAAAEVEGLVGSAVMTAAQAAYDESDPSEEQQRLYDTVRLPIAYLAIAMHAKLSGLSHGETGRKMKVDENEKIPFEWQIERDDREMRERYFRALDALIRYLDREGLEAWKDSELYRMRKGCVVGCLSDCERIYPVEHSDYTFAVMLPLFLEVQDGRLTDIIGADRVAALLRRDADVEKLRPAALRLVVLSALHTAVTRWSLDVFPLAITRRFAPSYQGGVSRTAATTAEIDWALKKLELQVRDAEVLLQTAVSGNPYDGMRLLPENDPSNKYFTV